MAGLLFGAVVIVLVGIIVIINDNACRRCAGKGV